MFADAALKGLLKGANLLYSNGLDTYFLKHGGSMRAMDDFFSVNPVNVKQSKLKGSMVSNNSITLVRLQYFAKTVS